jgi:hypothetical protein
MKRRIKFGSRHKIRVEAVPYLKEIERVTQKIRDARQPLNSQAIRIRLIPRQSLVVEEERGLLQEMARLKTRINDLTQGQESMTERR